MNENCKYCKTAKTCLENAEYNSIYCQIHKRIPKVIDKTYDELQQENQQLKEQNERLLELCMYALISSTKIYNHKLANDTKKSFINIIKNNLNYDTYILKNKLLEAWRSDK